MNCLFFFALFLSWFIPPTFAQAGGELRFCLRSEPKTFNPILVTDDSSEAIRYLTGGVLIRVNRLTQELVPELARFWNVAAKSVLTFVRESPFPMAPRFLLLTWLSPFEH